MMIQKSKLAKYQCRDWLILWKPHFMFLQLLLQIRLGDETLHSGTQGVSLSANALSRFIGSFFIRNIFEFFPGKAITDFANHLYIE
jgi:hypothetical protein